MATYADPWRRNEVDHMGWPMVWVDVGDCEREGVTMGEQSWMEEGSGARS